MTLLPTVVLLVILAAVIPDEVVPRVQDMGGGATEYCFQSLQSAILFPGGVLIALAFAVASLLIFKTKKIPTQERVAATGWRKHLRWTGKGLGYTIAACLLAMLAAVLFAVLVVVPSRSFRRVVVDQDTIEMHSLLRSWSLPRSRVVRARFVREDIVVREQPRADLSFLIEDDAGNRHRSVQVGLNPADAGFADYERAFKRLESQLAKEKK